MSLPPILNRALKASYEGANEIIHFSKRIDNLEVIKKDGNDLTTNLDKLVEDKVFENLKKYYPDFHFIPIYWMASEDHDFEEISCFNMFGNKYQWATKQTGAVGRFDPSSLADVINQINEKVELF